MILDSVSKKVVTIALYLESKFPNSISEIWIDEKAVNQLKQLLPSSNTIEHYINETKNEINALKDIDRKQYLQEILDSLNFQISNKHTSLGEFYKNTYGFEIQKVSRDELNVLENNIKKIEIKLNINRFDIFQSIEVNQSEVLTRFLEYLDKTKAHVPSFLTEIPESEFQYELVENKPWTAFNTHYAPYKSKLSINQSVPITLHDLHHLSQHEAWGGHHSELSLKDKLLVNEGKGEHGLVIVYSPQVFISEGLAEAMYDVLGLKDSISDEELLIWHYNHYLFALNNYFAFRYFDDHINKDQVENELDKFNVGKVGRKAIFDFSTDPIFGRYSAVYYSARDFILNIFNRTENKELLIKHLFTQPCTPTTLNLLFVK